MKIKKCHQKIIALMCNTLIIFQPISYYASAQTSSAIPPNQNKEVLQSQKNDQEKLSIPSGQKKNASSHHIQKRSVSSDKEKTSPVVSDAYNFKNFQQAVDPRTGVLNITYPIANITGNNLEDPSINLSLNYSSLGNRDAFGLGIGWGWNLTHYDPKSGILSLSNKGSYKVEIGKSEKLKYYKLKDIRVDIKENFITITYKNGTVEKIDRTFGNLDSITNALGHSAHFNYNGNKLSSITYSNEDIEIEKLKIEYGGNQFIIIKRNDGTPNWPTSIIKKSTNGNLTSIKNTIGQEIILKYEVPLNEKFLANHLVSEVLYPTGVHVKVSYLNEGIVGVNNSIINSAVANIKTKFLTNSEIDHEEIFYSYSDGNHNFSNYLGRGSTSNSSNEDNLFYAPSTYFYTTIEKRDSIQGFLYTKRKYNHFHLMVEESVILNSETLFFKEYIYPSFENKDFKDLDITYNLPKEIRTTYYNKNHEQRVESVKQSYDEYGNILKMEDATGLIKEYAYLPAQNTFNGISHLPVHLVFKALNTNQSHIMAYEYETVKNREGNDYQRIKKIDTKYSSILCQLNDNSCGKLSQSESYLYGAYLNLESEGRRSRTQLLSLPSIQKLTAYDENGNQKETINKFEYSANFNTNQVINYQVASEDKKKLGCNL
jgi:hypothetical protein